MNLLKAPLMKTGLHTRRYNLQGMALMCCSTATISIALLHAKSTAPTFDLDSPAKLQSLKPCFPEVNFLPGK